jgi:hypothetical protein
MLNKVQYSSAKTIKTRKLAGILLQQYNENIPKHQKKPLE